MPAGYERMRDKFARTMGSKAAKKKAARIWNSTHSGKESVGKERYVLVSGKKIMVQAVDRILFGLCFGLGFAIANAVIALIVQLLSHSHT